MKYRRTAQFKSAFEKLPPEIKEKAFKAFYSCCSSKIHIIPPCL
jgi:hypothetical protein